MHDATPTLVPLLISVLGGGTLVPLVYGIWQRFHSRTQDAEKGKAEIEDLASHASREAVEAVSGAIQVLRDQLKDRRDEIVVLRREKENDALEILRLRNRIREHEGLAPLD